jgi:hypothetical protein
MIVVKLPRWFDADLTNMECMRFWLMLWSNKTIGSTQITRILLEDFVDKYGFFT